MEIEEYLGKFEPAAPPRDLKERVLARSKPFKLWPLAAAAAALVALGLANARIESGLGQFAQGPAPRFLPPPGEVVLLHRELVLARPSGDSPQSFIHLRQEVLRSQL